MLLDYPLWPLRPNAQDPYVIKRFNVDFYTGILHLLPKKHPLHPDDEQINPMMKHLLKKKDLTVII